MRSAITLALLVLVAAIAVGGPQSPCATQALDLRGIVLLTITVVVIAVEGVRRLP